jgi:hypothetical protein
MQHAIELKLGPHVHVYKKYQNLLGTVDHPSARAATTDEIVTVGRQLVKLKASKLHLW